MEKVLAKTIRGLEKINWKDLNAASNSSKKILENIFNHRETVELLLKNVLRDKNLISLAEHYDFFDKIVVYVDKKDRFRIRVHIFSDDNSNRNRIHCHRWNYSSLILSGSYQHSIYGSEKDINEHIAIKNLRPILIQEEARGSIYTLGHDAFHTINAQENTVSLLVRGPSVKDRFLIMDKTTNKKWWEYGRESETIEEIESKNIPLEDLKNLINKLSKVLSSSL